MLWLKQNMGTFGLRGNGHRGYGGPVHAIDRIGVGNCLQSLNWLLEIFQPYEHIVQWT